MKIHLICVLAFIPPLVSQAELTISQITIPEGEINWYDISKEIKLIHADQKSYENDQADLSKPASNVFRSEFFKGSSKTDDIRTLGFENIMGNRYEPTVSFLEKAHHLFIGDMGKPLMVDLSLSNGSAKAVEITSITIVVEDYHPKKTTRGDGFLELEALDFETEREVRIKWPSGYFQEPYDENVARVERGESLPEKPGYTVLEKTLDTPITVFAEDKFQLHLKIMTADDEFPFGCGHHLFRIVLASKDQEIASESIYLIGSHWWMNNDLEEDEIAESVSSKPGFMWSKDLDAIVWNNIPKPDDIPVWEGQADSDGFADGIGKLSWYKGSRFQTSYEGRMIRGRLEGETISRDADGSTNIRFWKKGKKIKR